MVQGVFALRCARFAPLMCGATPLAAPSSQRLTHQAARLLAPLSLFSLHPSGLAPPASDPAAECCTVLRFLQLSMGLLAPLAWQAGVEAALFAAHQRQRQAAGLPPERGPSAALYELVGELRHPAVVPHLWVCGLLALGLCWFVAVGTSAGGRAA